MKPINLYVPLLNAVARRPDAHDYYMWYKGTKVAHTELNARSRDTLLPYVRHVSNRFHEHITQIRLSLFANCSNPELSDFTLGADDDPQPICFDWKIADEQTQEAYAIFEKTFGSDWKLLAQWISTLAIPRAHVKSTYDSRNKTLKIDYEDFRNSKFVFLCSGKIYDVRYRNEAYDIPTDLKLENVQMARIPLIWWLIVYRPTEFVDTATTCMRFKKMIVDQLLVHHIHESAAQQGIWLMNGDEMYKMTITNTYVNVRNKRLSLEEVEQLHSRKNDFWVAGYDLDRRLFTNP